MLGRIRSTAATARAIHLVDDEPDATSVAMRGTPEVYFPKSIDNSRLVKVNDPQRAREMKQFAIACALLFAFVMVYAWQHFSAIEYGYRIEAQRAQVESLNEANRQLRLEQAALRDPERIDVLARRMGMTAPEIGQVVRLEPQPADTPAPIVASVAGVSAAR
jgi:cell division protein FtsL